MESRILSNIDYNIHNRSNYDIVEEETRDIVDVPCFPAQNLVDVSGVLNVYDTSCVDLYIPFKDSQGKERLFGLIFRNDARYVFVELADDARYLHYKMQGNSFPQGREGASFTYDGRYLYLFGGFANARAMDDMWICDLEHLAWVNENFSIQEHTTDEHPSRRLKTSIVKLLDTLWLFGGETDILTINSDRPANLITLNDIWKYDFNTKTWTNFDKNRILPHRPGHVIHVDSNKVRILVAGGKNELGIDEPTAVWDVDLNTDEVTNTPLTNVPFTPSFMNVCLEIDGVIHILTKDAKLYKWNNNEFKFELILEDVTAINPSTKHYWKVRITEKYFGDNELMGKFKTLRVADEYDASGNLITTKTINLPPRGEYIHRINIDNLQTFFYGGLIDDEHFNETTYIMNHTTRQVYKYDFPSTDRPTERMFTTLAYDRYRGRVWLFGGSDGSKFYNDLWYFDLGGHTWTKVEDVLENSEDEEVTRPQPRHRAGMCIVAEDYLYIIGGVSDSHAYNDLWCYYIKYNRWERIYTTDDIPWGSTYFIFEWKDRLWLWNGRKLYRYFYELKQFVEQPVVMDDDTRDRSEVAIDLFEKQNFMETPVTCTLVNDYLIIENQNKTFYIDMETKVLTDLRLNFGLSPKAFLKVPGRTTDMNVPSNQTLLWLDRYYAISVLDLSEIYINVSPLLPLTKNQHPATRYIYKLGLPTLSSYSRRYQEDKDKKTHETQDKVLIGDVQGVIPMQLGYFYRDLLAVTGEPKLRYHDSSGLFVIQPEVIYLNKGELLVDRCVGIAGVPSELPGVNFDNPDSLWDSTIDMITKPYSVLYSPWFLYAKYRPGLDLMEGVQKVLYNAKTKRVYIVYQNGNVVRVNPKDGTFFTYFFYIWYQSAIGYYNNTNKMYAFSGIQSNKRKAYNQAGLEWVPAEHEAGGYIATEMTHPGFMEMDLNLNEMNLGSIENYLIEHKATMVDYTVTRDYLAGMVQKYVEGYRKNTIQMSLEEVKKKIYESTKEIVDDLSQFDITFEKGIRPTPRAYTANVQIDQYLYIFGGCEIQQRVEADNPFYTPGIVPDFVQATHYKRTTPEYAPEFLPPEEEESNDQGHEEDENEDKKILRIIRKESKKAFRYNMATGEWEELPPLPEWRYMAGCIADPTGRYIYIVGGYTDTLYEGITNSILRYDTYLQKYEEIKGIPSKFYPRAMPILEWIDESHLLIMGGFRIFPKITAIMGVEKLDLCTVKESWIYDTRTNLMYKAFEDMCSDGAIVIKDNYVEEDRNILYVLTPIPEKDTEYGIIVTLFKWNLVNGEVERMKLIPTSTIREDFSIFEEDEPYPEGYMLVAGYGPQSQCKGNPTVADRIANSNFRFRYGWIQRYGPYNHRHLFIIGERAEKSGIDFVERMAQGYEEAHLRFWYVDIDVIEPGRLMKNIVYDYPLPISPVVVSYDGRQYLYVIYNKYNLYRLDFQAMLKDPSGSYWSKLPPAIDANFLGDARTSNIWTGYHIDPNYLLLVSVDGRMARMDCGTLVWFADKLLPPADGLPRTMKVPEYLRKMWENFHEDLSDIVTFNEEVIRFATSALTDEQKQTREANKLRLGDRPPLTSATGIDKNEIYLVCYGGINGKIINIYEKQWDNFYFDMRIVSNVPKKLGPVVEKGFWPTVIRRRRLYVMNELGHIFYAWLRLDGIFDVEYQLEDFYDADYIRIYCDEKPLYNWDRFTIWIYDIKSGWREIPKEACKSVINETGWDWEMTYTRRYVRKVVDGYNNVVTQVTKCPPNYLEVDLSKIPNKAPISKVRVKYQNKYTGYNYMTHINKVEVVTTQKLLAAYDSPTSPNPIELIGIDAIAVDEIYSNAIGITVMNTSTKTAKDVFVYARENEWIQMTLDPNDDESWTIRDETNPFKLADELFPGQKITFYIRGVNIDMRPHVKDLVIIGVFPYE